MQRFIEVLKIARKPEVLFLCISLPFCIAFALAIPAGAGYDEHFHTCRVIELAHGNLFTDPLGSSDDPKMQEWGGEVDKGLYETLQENWTEFHLGSHEDYSFPIWGDERITSDRTLGEDYDVYAYGSAAIYSPIVYLPYIIGYWIGSPFFNNAYALILFMRIMGILFYCAAMFLFIRKIDFGRWVLCCIGLLPNVLCTFSTITADPVTFIGVIGTLVLFIRLCGKSSAITAKEAAWVAAASLVVCFSKVAYLPVLLLFLALPLLNPSFRNKKNYLPIVLIVLISGILFLLWYMKTNSASLNAAATGSAALDPSAQRAYILSNPFSYLGLLGETLFAQNVFDLRATGVASEYAQTGGWLGIIALCLACFARDERDAVPESLKKHYARFIILCFVVFLLISGLMYTALYLQFTPVESHTILGVQTRYFIPLIPLLIMPLPLLSAIYLRERRKGEILYCAIKRYLILLLCINALAAIGLIYMGIYIGK